MFQPRSYLSCWSTSRPLLLCLDANKTELNDVVGIILQDAKKETVSLVLERLHASFTCPWLRFVYLQQLKNPKKPS